MKKTVSFFLSINILIISLVGCVEGSSTKKAIESEIGATGSDKNTKIVVPTITEQKCFEYNGLTVTAKGIENDSIWGIGVNLLIENNSDMDLTVGCDSLIVNNCMLTDLFSCDISAGKKSNETLNLLSSQLKAAGIDNIGQIEVYFHVTDSNFDTLFNSECVTIKTSDFNSMDATPDDSGHELYNKKGIRIIGKYVDENSIWGSSVLLYVENKTGKNITVQTKDVSVNGFMVTDLFSCTVYSQKYAFDDITLLKSDLEKNGISSIDNIELKFNIFDEKSLDTIVETDAIRFTAK